MELKRKGLLYLPVLSGVLEVKDGLGRTGMKKIDKMAKSSCIGMWSQMHVLEMDRWLNGCKIIVLPLNFPLYCCISHLGSHQLSSLSWKDSRVLM